MQQKSKTYKMYWRSKKRPDNMGEGRPVFNERVAQHLCDQHNTMFPQFHHWYEEA